jgi:PKD repeat protein
MKKNISSFVLSVTFLLLSISQVQCQTKRVLFIGNSYTSYNNLPQLVQSLSTSAGKTLIIDSSMPGGYPMSSHLEDATTFAKISQGNWDYVILQEQSQIPTIEYIRDNDMYPAMTDLKALIEQYNPCAKIITYMTWGRRYGGQQCDPSGTYCSPVFANFNQMQNSLTSAYLEISEQLNVQCAPVGVVWQNILNNSTNVLHSGDNSHPNIDGSYVAACTIFSSIWKQGASGLSYTAGISSTLAQYYQSISDNTLFNSTNDWNLNINNPTANFSESISGNTATFTNLSTSIANTLNLNYSWNFGDGNTSSIANPSHTYTTSGTYTITLIASNCTFSNTITKTIQIGALSINENAVGNFKFYPNPTTNQITLKVDNQLLGSVYTIYDTVGKSVLNGKINSELNVIDLGNLSNGVYIIEVASEGNYFKNKFIKN